MDPFSATFSAYACGLALFSLAALVYFARWGDRTGRRHYWLIGFAVAQGASEWISLIAEPNALSARVLFDVAALVALVEYGRGAMPARSTIDRRWMYVLLAALLIAAAAGQAAWLPVGLSVLLAVQGGLLIGSHLIRSLAAEKQHRLSIVCAVAAGVYLLANALQSPVWKLVALSTITGGMWLVKDCHRRAAGQKRSRRHYGWPAAFCCLLIVGAFVFTPPASQLDESLVTHEQPLFVAEAEPEIHADQSVWLQACCLAFTPPVLLLGAGWLLSHFRSRSPKPGM
jgi:hypothetical protein